MEAHGAGAAAAATAVAPTAPAVSQGKGVSVRTENQALSPALPNHYARDYSNRNFYASNRLAWESNRLGWNSNRFGLNSNRWTGSNNLAPTGAATGGATSANQLNNNAAIRDQGVTPMDQGLVVTIGQELQNQLGITSPQAMPVHFFINNGVVTLVGNVPNAADGHRILMQVQQTAGVSRVINRLHVGMPPAYVRPKTAPAYVGQTTDHAFSPADRSVLSAVQQTAATELGLGSTAAIGQLPVHFSIQNGIVSVSGQVATQAARLALLSALRRTPGVVGVYDDLQIGGQAGLAVPQGGATGQ